jgi:hypothetical protein
MAEQEVLGRKNEILKKKIENMIMIQNKNGLSSQDSKLMQSFIKEFHHNNYTMR